MTTQPLYLTNPMGLVSLIERDYFQGPNFYQRARTAVHSAIVHGDTITWEARDASVYGAVLFVTIAQHQTLQVTKGKVRWSDLGFYGLHRHQS